jgi:flagellar biosynthesis/type III secretory pathway chaperone
MLSSVPTDKLWKYNYLLELALEQLRAIECGDQKRLQLIIEQKWSLIRSLSGTKELMTKEPTLPGIIERIQKADKLAETRLAARMGTVREQLCQINKRRSAKRVYCQAGRQKHPVLGLALDDTTPRFFDIKS